MKAFTKVLVFLCLLLTSSATLFAQTVIDEQLNNNTFVQISNLQNVGSSFKNISTGMSVTSIEVSVNNVAGGGANTRMHIYPTNNPNGQSCLGTSDDLFISAAGIVTYVFSTPVSLARNVYRQCPRICDRGAAAC